MKRILVILLLSLSTSLFTFCKAQQEFGQIVINAGVGLGSWYYGGSTYIDEDGDGISNYSSEINLDAEIDYGLSKRFSAGIVVSYNSEIVSWTPEYPPYCSDKITMFNMALRFLFHLNKKHTRFDHYIGIGPGYCHLQDIPSPNNNNIINGTNTVTFYNNPNKLTPSFEVLYGMRIYLSNNVGIHFEAGIGSPYLIEGGLTFRINTRKTNPQSNTPQDTYGGH